MIILLHKLFLISQKNHNCIKELRKVINDQQNRINQLTNEVYKQKNDIDRVTTDLRSLEVRDTKRYF